MAPPVAGKPTGLKRKLGPLPAWAWVLIAAGVVGYFMFFRRGGDGTATGQIDMATPQGNVASPSPESSMGLAPSAGSAGDNGSSVDALMSAFGSNQSQVDTLTQALLAESGQVVQLAQQQLDYAASQTALSPFDTTEPMASTQPGGANAPTVSYHAPPPKAKTTAPGHNPIVQVRTTKTGGKVTTFANGRQIQQEKGRPAYVVRKAAPAKAPARAPAPKKAAVARKPAPKPKPKPKSRIRR